jgi:prophage antirepressor-like protein
MNELTVFDYNNSKVRTVMVNGEPWFVLKDVCDILEIGNAADVSRRLDNDEKGVDSIDTLGGKQKITIISESGLYKVILRSDKPEANRLMRFVTHEVLPSIRKHGGYLTEATTEKLIANPDLIIELATALKNERSENRLLLDEKSQLETELDESKEYYTVKRVACINGISWKQLDWRKLKNSSQAMEYEVKKIFDANYGNVNSYHVSVWKYEYPNLIYDK